MTDASVAVSSLTGQRGLKGDARFLVQVSRPGLWSTTALFYLLPLGRADFAHFGRLWLGLIFVLFPLGLLLYGVNDLADAEADQLNPRKGTYMFGSRGGREQLDALKWQIVVAQLPFLAAFYWLVGPRILWWYAILLLAVGLYKRAAFRMERPSTLGRGHPGELPVGVRIEQLAEQRAPTSLADVFVWSIVCHALARFWRGDGH